MIKKYIQFIKEKLTIGEQIESVYTDEYVKNIVNRYINHIDPSIRLANAINLLDKRTQREIKAQVDEYLENGLKDKKVVVSATTDTSNMVSEAMAQEEISLSGKGVFKSFLKSLTALGKKDNKPNYKDCTNDFLLYFKLEGILPESIRSIFSRFKSLSRYIDFIDYTENEVDLYFGIKTDGYFEYGIGQRKIIGKFKLNKSTIKWILNIDSKSSKTLKTHLVNLSYTDILILGKIKNDMINYKPGHFQEKSPVYINDNVISFGYYGVGKWENGELSIDDINSIKSNLNDWILSKKWSDKVLFSVKPDKFWLYIHIKLK